MGTPAEIEALYEKVPPLAVLTHSAHKPMSRCESGALVVSLQAGLRPRRAFADDAVQALRQIKTNVMPAIQANVMCGKDSDAAKLALSELEGVCTFAITLMFGSLDQLWLPCIFDRQ